MTTPPQYREQVAPGIERVHARGCTKAKPRGRCNCEPVYRARVRTGTRGNQRTHSGTFPTLSAAADWREMVQAGGTSARPPKVPTLGEAARSFIIRARDGMAVARTGKPYAATTLNAYEVALRVRVLPTPDPATGIRVADLPADRLLEPQALQGLVSAWHQAGESSAKVRQATAATRAVLRYLYELRALPTLPPSVLLPPPPKRRDRVYVPEEVESLILAAEVDDLAHGVSLMGPLIALMAETGLRVNEAFSLRWGPDGLMVNDTEGSARVASKTAAGERKVYIYDPATLEKLARHRLATGSPAEGELVFARADGQPFTRHGAPRYGLRRIANAAGVEDAGWHAFRHTHATELGSDPEVDANSLAARLGHADAAFTSRHYVHNTDQRARELARIAAYRRKHRKTR